MAVTVPAQVPANAPTNVGQKHMLVTWGAPDNNGSHIDYYQTRWSDNSDGSDDTGAHFDLVPDYLPREYDAYVTDTNTHYYFWIRAHNSKGYGPWSNRVNGYSLPTLPKTPDTPALSSVSSSGVTVTFHESMTYEGTTRERQVGYGTDPNTVQSTVTATVDMLYYGAGSTGISHAVITGLKRYTTYYFWARVRNDGGWGPWSPKASIATLAELPDWPTITNLDAASQTSLRVRYSDPTDTGGTGAPILERQVGYDTNGSATTPKYTYSGDRDDTIGGLSRYTVYYVWVRVRNAAGWSDWSISKNIRTLAYTPAPPVGLNHGETSQTTSRITYSNTGVDNGGAAILDGEIGWGTSSTAPQNFVTSNGNTVVTGLPAGVVVYFWVRNRNVQGKGSWSARMQITTVAGADLKVGGVWKNAVPWARWLGKWYVAQPYIRVNGVWKKTG